MPQLDLYGAPVAHQIDWQYRVNPLHPNDPGRFICLVGRGKGTIVESVGFDVPLNVVHEIVADMLSESWQHYLYGEPGDLRAVTNTVVRTWKRESALRPSW